MNNNLLQTLKKLNVTFELNYTVEMANFNKVIYDLYIKDFGGKKGTLVLFKNSKNQKANFENAKLNGYYCSMFYNDSEFNEKTLIDTLNDWGYFGIEAKKPKWYTGWL